MNLNIDFKKQIDKILPADEATRLMQTIEAGEPVVSLRFNDAKGFAVPSGLEQVPWCDMGAYLNERPQFTFDPHFHAGSYYVQDASSMFIYHVIKTLVKQPVAYLDLCAAPGGKTTAAIQALPQGSMVVANEIVPQRAQILRENVIKWGASNCMVTCDSPRAFGALESEFDVIAADVPCSGEGMFRKDDEAVSQWSSALVQQCAARQREIISAIWPALKPGGLLIYSTCTYNTLENEEMVNFITQQFSATTVEVTTNPSWGILPAIGLSMPCYRFMPHSTRGEGLFMCVMRKPQGPQASHRPTKQKSKKSFNAKLVPDIKQWIDGEYSFMESNGTIQATPLDVKFKLECIYDNIHIIKDLGTSIATIKGRKTIPSHELALSAHLAHGAFPQVEVDYPTAINFLRGEAITIDAPRGHVLITYENSVLGFVNNLGNRANNLYPKSWRIMSSHRPEEAPSIL